ncbi:hypothetical protein GGI43DRAFT_165983 [Trichoderma evansii]
MQLQGLGRKKTTREIGVRQRVCGAYGRPGMRLAGGNVRKIYQRKIRYGSPHFQKDNLQASERVVEDTEARKSGGKRRRDFFYVMGIEKRGASSFYGGNVCAGAGPPSLWPFMERVRGRSGACDSRLATNWLMGALRLGLAHRRGAA